MWVYTRYPLSLYMSSVDAPCVYGCGGPTHDERRRASKSHEWRLSDAAGACVWVHARYPTTVHMCHRHCGACECTQLTAQPTTVATD